MVATRAWFAAAALIASTLAPLHAAPTPDWELLGFRRVSFSSERDVITVGSHEGRFTAIKVEVDGGNLEMYDVRITFGDGHSWSPQTRVVFREGSWSRAIDLPGDARVIRRVEFRYRSQLRRGSASVRVYGREANRGTYRPSAVPRLGNAAARWEQLGTRHVNYAAERDAIDVGARAGRFTAIKLDVDGGNLDMFDVRVTFGDGTSWSPATRLHFREGSWSRTIDLPGDARVIKRITFRYRSEGRKGRAWVRVYGREAVAPPPPTVQPPHSRENRSAPAGWDRIATRNVSFRADHDAVVAIGQGQFRALRIDVEDATIEMYEIKVTFADGSVFSPQTRVLFRADSRSRVIDLPGASRTIRRIDFRYRSVDRRPVGTATVQVYGRR